MRTRIFWVMMIFVSAVSLMSARSVSADPNCDESVHFNFPDNWYTLSAGKEPFPQRPIVKQQLEELAARGDLSQPPSHYDVNFKANLTLLPGTAKWNNLEKHDEWKWDCTREMELWGLCKQRGHWEKVEECVAQKPAAVYRSIEKTKFFLIPDEMTQEWYKNFLSPKIILAYPDFWEPVTIGEGGDVLGDYGNQLDGPHFLNSDPLRPHEFYYPSKLPQEGLSFAVINSADEGIVLRYIHELRSTIIPICDVTAVENVDYGFEPPTVFNYGYDNIYGVNTDIEADPYNCNIIATMAEVNKVESIDLQITHYDFDIPGTFYIGFVTQIAPAKSPVDDTPETIDNAVLQPSNIGDDSYKNSQFSVWMVASAPCWLGDNGCNTYTPPDQ